MSSDECKVQVVLKHARGSPKFISIGPKGERFAMDVPVSWDTKSDIYLWFMVSTSLDEMIDYTHPTLPDPPLTYRGEAKDENDDLISRCGAAREIVSLFNAEDRTSFEIAFRPHAIVSRKGVHTKLIPIDEGQRSLANRAIACRVGFKLTAADVLSHIDQDVFPTEPPIHFTGDGKLSYLWCRGSISFGNFCVCAHVTHNGSGLYSIQVDGEVG